MDVRKTLIGICIVAFPIALLSQVKNTIDTTQSSKWQQEVLLGTPIFPKFFYNFGWGGITKGWASNVSTKKAYPFLWLSKMEENNYFFPPINIIYRRNANAGKNAKLQIGITYYKTPLYYRHQYNIETPISYFFLNAGVQRVIYNNATFSICWNYDLFLGHVNSQIYSSTYSGTGYAYTISGLQTFLFGPDIGGSVKLHLTEKLFLESEVSLLFSAIYNNGKVAYIGSPPFPKNVKWDMDILFPKLFGICVGYNF